MRALMKLVALAVLLLAGCADVGYNPMGVHTAPGSEMPAFFDICDKADAAGRCEKWRYGNGKIRPYDKPSPD